MKYRKVWALALVAIFLSPALAAAADPLKDAMQKGKACFDKGDYDGAVAAYSEAIKLDPMKADAYGWRAWAFERKDNFGKAGPTWTRPSASIKDGDCLLRPRINPPGTKTPR